MIKISEVLLYVFLFFFLSTGIYLIMINIGVSNNNLSDDSIKDINNLQIYNSQNTNPFADGQQINYSLTDYSNTQEFAQSNLETKGALQSVLDIFGDNSLTAIQTPLLFIENLSPLPDAAFSWTKTMLISFVGIVIFVGFIAAWKGGIF